MSWFYYYCMHGPGHQSTDDGYIEATDETYAKNLLRGRFSDLESPITSLWKIKSPPRRYFESKIKDCESQIKCLKDRIKRHRQQLSLCNQSEIDEPGEDKLLTAAMERIIDHEFIKRLHAADIIVEPCDVRRWRGLIKSLDGNVEYRRPIARLRRKVLNAARKSPKYPRYKNGA